MKRIVNLAMIALTLMFVSGSLLATEEVTLHFGPTDFEGSSKIRLKKEIEKERPNYDLEDYKILSVKVYAETSGNKHGSLALKVGSGTTKYYQISQADTYDDTFASDSPDCVYNYSFNIYDCNYDDFPYVVIRSPNLQYGVSRWLLKIRGSVTIEKIVVEIEDKNYSSWFAHNYHCQMWSGNNCVR